MKNFHQICSLEPNLTVEIQRIHVDKDFLRKKKLIPIQNSAFFEISLHLQKDPLILPKFYAALCYMTGSSDYSYDDYKGSFSFTFQLEVNKNEQFSNYLYRIYHYRSYIEFSVYHITLETDPRDPMVMYQPSNELFSDADIRHFSANFLGYCLGYLEGSKYIPQSFINCADSNLLMFGYYKTNYFFRQYDNESRYKKMKNKIDSLINTLG